LLQLTTLSLGGYRMRPPRHHARFFCCWSVLGVFAYMQEQYWANCHARVLSDIECQLRPQRDVQRDRPTTKNKHDDVVDVIAINARSGCKGFANAKPLHAGTRDKLTIVHRCHAGEYIYVLHVHPNYSRRSFKLLWWSSIEVSLADDKCKGLLPLSHRLDKAFCINRFIPIEIDPRV
jgi:hypothetical protein